MVKAVQIFILFVIFVSFVVANADFYTSTAGLETLIDAEVHFLDALEDYLYVEEQKHANLQEFLYYVEDELKHGDSQNDSYYDNPINALNIIKRFSRDWYNAQNYLLEATNEDQHRKLLELHKNFKLPHPDDLLGAARGIARLQRTYRLKTEEVRQGYIRKIKASPALNSSDTFHLGLSLLQAENYLYATEWLTETLKLYVQELHSESFKSIDSSFIEEEQILEQLAAASYFNGDLIFANWVTKQMLQLNSTNQIASQNLQFYSEAMSANRFRLEHTTEPQIKVVDRKKEIMIKALDQYEKVCSGELKPTPAQQRNLRCKFFHNNVPFCILAPFKLEELCLEPYIARYYDIISEVGIKEILSKSTNNIERSRVFGASTEERIYSEMRTSKNAWLWYHQHPFMNNLKQRLQDISGLSMGFSTALQVANYGIGGHYEPHCDFRYESKEFGSRGNRVKTALLYLNSVQMGGATAFPFLNFAAVPIKGSLIIWQNLHKSGEGDYRTRHGSCPVLKGTKWIGTEWIHEYGQILTCDLKSDSSLSLEFEAPVN